MANQERPSSPEEKLHLFREEMRAWVAQEAENKKAWEARGGTGDAYDPHAEDINPDHLTEDDRAIAEEISAHTITFERWRAYDRALKEQVRAAPEEIQKSRGMFRAYMGNKAQQILLQRQLEDMQQSTR